jgi:oxygen-independent coproporphyrinogen-3 oxidase
MEQILLERYAGAVPRYTSYPTAPHFTPEVGEGTFRDWLARLSPGSPVSLYLHVPFCREMCWYCGCHTKVVRRPEPVAEYARDLRREIELVAEAIPGRIRVASIHWGGGTPTLLSERDFSALMDDLRGRFQITGETEVAVEIDPRDLDEKTATMLAAAGVDRASLGVQDFDRQVQEAVNRVQPYEVTARSVELLRRAGIEAINFDLMYGLPRQTVAGVVRSAELAAGLAPDRIALFGYAHVPWMKKHQRLIDEAALPDPLQRAQQFEAAAACLLRLGFEQIGLDHFARPEDPLSVALKCGRLRRNFQGYTSDSADTLIGLGVSAISSLSEGYAQNEAAAGRYAAAIRDGRLATARGIRLKCDDYLRRAVIERLMCDGEVDLDTVRRDFGMLAMSFDSELAALRPMVSDGLVRLDGERIRVTPAGKPFVRVAAAAFDRYFRSAAARHSQAI